MANKPRQDQEGGLTVRGMSPGQRGAGLGNMSTWVGVLHIWIYWYYTEDCGNYTVHQTTVTVLYFSYSSDTTCFCQSRKRVCVSCMVWRWSVHSIWHTDLQHMTQDYGWVVYIQSYICALPKKNIFFPSQYIKQFDYIDIWLGLKKENIREHWI